MNKTERNVIEFENKRIVNCRSPLKSNENSNVV